MVEMTGDTGPDQETGWRSGASEADHGIMIVGGTEMAIKVVKAAKLVTGGIGEIVRGLRAEKGTGLEEVGLMGIACPVLHAQYYIQC